MRYRLDGELLLQPARWDSEDWHAKQFSYTWGMKSVHSDKKMLSTTVFDTEAKLIANLTWMTSPRHVGKGTTKLEAGSSHGQPCLTSNVTDSPCLLFTGVACPECLGEPRRPRAQSTCISCQGDLILASCDWSCSYRRRFLASFNDDSRSTDQIFRQGGSADETPTRCTLPRERE